MLVLPLLALLLLAACAEPPGEPQAKSVDKVGFVLLSEASFDGEPRLTGQASFVADSQPFPADLLSEPFDQQVGSCAVSVAGTPSGDEPPHAEETGYLTVGDRLQLDVGGDTFGNLVRNDQNLYRLQATAASLPAAGLTLSVPLSGNFPAFEGVEVATGSHVVFDGAFDPSAIGPTTEFRWAPGTPGRSTVLLVGAQDTTAFSCIVPDTGSFRFPSDTAAELEEAAFTAGALTTAGRLTLTSQVNGEATLVIGAMRLGSPASLGSDWR